MILITKHVHLYENIESMEKIHRLFGMDIDEAYELADKEGFKIRLKRMWPGTLIARTPSEPGTLEVITADDRIVGIKYEGRWFGLPEMTDLTEEELPAYKELYRRLDIWRDLRSKASWRYNPEEAKVAPFPIKPVEFNAHIFDGAKKQD